MPPSLSSLLAPFPPSTHAALARLHAALAAPQPPLVALHALPHSARAAVAVVLFLDCAAHPAAFRPFVSPSEAERGSGSSAEEGKPEWLVLLTTRSLTVGSHPGQASLPGGKMERGEDARRTAAREMREEIALDVREGAVEVGEGKSFLSKTNLLVTPIFYMLPPSFAQRALPKLRACPCEVAAMWAYPLRALLSSHAPQAPRLRLQHPTKVDRHRPPQEAFRTWSDVPWMHGGTYRLHRFRSGHELVKGLTADILLYATTLLLDKPAFDILSPTQPSWEQVVQGMVERMQRNEGRGRKRWGDGESGDKEGEAQRYATCVGRDGVETSG